MEITDEQYKKVEYVLSLGLTETDAASELDMLLKDFEKIKKKDAKLQLYVQKGKSAYSKTINEAALVRIKKEDSSVIKAALSQLAPIKEKPVAAQVKEQKKIDIPVFFSSPDSMMSNFDLTDDQLLEKAGKNDFESSINSGDYDEVEDSDEE